MKKEIKAGIIGLGVGEAHIKGYESHTNCKVTKVCDFNQKVRYIKRDSIGNIEFTTNPNDILKDPNIDVVSIASYDNYHFDQIMLAIKHNKHIFIEKPLCLFENEALKIYEALDQKPNLKMSSNLILRQSERFIDLKKRTKKEEFGKLYYVKGSYNYGRLSKITDGWRGKIPFYSITYGGGVHIIDLILWIFEKKITEVYSMGNNISSKNTQFNFPDLVTSVLRFEDGANGQITSNFGCVYPHFHEFDLYGTNATFVNYQESAKIFKKRGSHEFEKINTKYPGVHKGDLLLDFIDSILNDRDPKVNKKDVFNTMCVCYALEKSLNTKKLENVNYLF